MCWTYFVFTIFVVFRDSIKFLQRNGEFTTCIFKKNPLRNSYLYVNTRSSTVYMIIRTFLYSIEYYSPLCNDPIRLFSKRFFPNQFLILRSVMFTDKVSWWISSFPRNGLSWNIFISIPFWCVVKGFADFSINGKVSFKNLLSLIYLSRSMVVLLS